MLPIKQVLLASASGDVCADINNVIGGRDVAVVKEARARIKLSKKAGTRDAMAHT
jgi:hypothetical protein